MPIDIGDAVLTFTGDTTQLDAAFNRIASETGAKLGPAAAAIDTATKGTKDLGEGLDNAGKSGGEAGKNIKDGMDKAESSSHEARGEVALLGDLFGIHLPRHVRSFIAELPIISTALNAAFSATAILFIIEAIGQVIEKFEGMSKAAKELQKEIQKFNDDEQKTFQQFQDDLLKAQARVADLTGNHLEAMRLKMQLIDNLTLGKLRGEVEKLGQELDKIIDKEDRGFLLKLLGPGFEGTEKVKEQLGEIDKAVDQALAKRTPESFKQALDTLSEGLKGTTKDLGDLTEQQAKFEEGAKKIHPLLGTAHDDFEKFMEVRPVDPKHIVAVEQLQEHLQALIETVKEAQKAEEEEKKAADLEERKRQVTELQQQAKRDLDERLAGIKLEQETQFTAFNAQKIGLAEWTAAQVKATADTNTAQDQYHAKLLEIQKTFPDTAKISAVAQEGVTESVKRTAEELGKFNQEIFRAQQELTKLHAEMDKIVFTDESLKSAKELTTALKELEAAEHKVTDAQVRLNETEIATNIKTQEAAIRALASLRIISKRQEVLELARLGEEEEKTSLAILTRQLADEQRALNTAKVKFAEATKDALFPDAELAHLKKNLDEAQAAWSRTQGEIEKALGQEFIKAVNLAVASGNRLLVQELQSTHAALIAAQAKLAEARAHGANTKAIDDEVKALLRQEAALEASAQRTKKLSDLTLELTNTFQTAVQAEAASFETAMDGMLSKNESFGKAMEEAQLKLIASLAKHWAQFFAEKAIADIFFHPALGIAEFAAAAGLFAIAGALSGAAGSLSSTSSTKSTSASSSAATTAASTAQTTPPQTINVAHLDSGGFITQPTLAVVHGQEAVVPLQNQSAMTAIGKAIAAHIAGLPGQSHEISIQLHSDIPALASVLNHNVRTGRVRLMASDSIRVTRRS